MHSRAEADKVRKKSPSHAENHSDPGLPAPQEGPSDRAHYGYGSAPDGEKPCPSRRGNHLYEPAPAFPAIHVEAPHLRHRRRDRPRDRGLPQAFDSLLLPWPRVGRRERAPPREWKGEPVHHVALASRRGGTSPQKVGGEGVQARRRRRRSKTRSATRLTTRSPSRRGPIRRATPHDRCAGPGEVLLERATAPQLVRRHSVAKGEEARRADGVVKRHALPREGVSEKPACCKEAQIWSGVQCMCMNGSWR